MLRKVLTLGACFFILFAYLSFALVQYNEDELRAIFHSRVAGNQTSSHGHGNEVRFVCQLETIWNFRYIIPHEAIVVYAKRPNGANLGSFVYKVSKRKIYAANEMYSLYKRGVCSEEYTVDLTL